MRRGSTVRLGFLSLDWELDDSSTGKVRVRRRWVVGLDVEARGSLGGDALRVLRVAGMMIRGQGNWIVRGRREYRRKYRGYSNYFQDPSGTRSTRSPSWRRDVQR